MNVCFSLVCMGAVCLFFPFLSLIIPLHLLFPFFSILSFIHFSFIANRSLPSTSLLSVFSSLCVPFHSPSSSVPFLLHSISYHKCISHLLQASPFLSLLCCLSFLPLSFSFILSFLPSQLITNLFLLYHKPLPSLHFFRIIFFHHTLPSLTLTKVTCLLMSGNS